MKGQAPEPEPALDPADEELLVAVARRVARYRMEVPAVLFLESVRPLSFVGSQTLVFFEPVLQSLFNWAQYDRFTRLMSERKNLDRLTRWIEREADARDAAEKEARKAAKERRKHPGAS